MKTCNICKKEKSLTEFHKHNGRKDGYNEICKECRIEDSMIYYSQNQIKIRKNNKLRRLEKPWLNCLVHISQRTSNSKSSDFKNYGGRGIKNYLTKEDVKFLWFRDKAYEMKKPSIDRIDNDGNYELSNCQFIEFIENSVKDKRKPILQFDLDGNFIKEWPSIAEAGRGINRCRASILRALNNFDKNCGDFKWKYKNE